jgi:hypothetical protein
MSSREKIGKFQGKKIDNLVTKATHSSTNRMLSDLESIVPGGDG